MSDFLSQEEARDYGVDDGSSRARAGQPPEFTPADVDRAPDVYEAAYRQAYLTAYSDTTDEAPSTCAGPLA